MLKKVILGSVGLGVLATVLIMTGVSTYFGAAYRMAHDSAVDSIPMELQLERARGMITDLEPVIKNNMRQIAREEGELSRLDKQIAGLDETLTDGRDDLMRLTTDLENEEDFYVYAGRNYTPLQVKEDLGRKFERFQTNESTLENLKKVRDARTVGLDAARQKLDGLISSKQQLVLEVENLEARAEMIAAAKTTSEVHFDDGRLGQVKELVDNLEMRLDVDERLLNSEVHYPGEIQLDNNSEQDDIVSRVAEHLGVGQPDIEVIVVSE